MRLSRLEKSPKTGMAGRGGCGGWTVVDGYEGGDDVEGVPVAVVDGEEANARRQEEEEIADKARPRSEPSLPRVCQE